MGYAVRVMVKPSAVERDSETVAPTVAFVCAFVPNSQPYQLIISLGGTGTSYCGSGNCYSGGESLSILLFDTCP